MNLTINKIKQKKFKDPIVCLTAYTTPVAKIVDQFSDIVLVGDSLGMVMYGFKSTRDVTLEMMIAHGKAVKKGISKSILVVDMPYKTYESDPFVAYKNAYRLMKETGCDAVKLEGGKKIIKCVQFLIKKKIPVMGHIGLLPQTATKYSVKGRNNSSIRNILNDAIILEKAGCFSIIVECVTKSLADTINKKISIPTIGIGASNTCDGQVLVIDDLLGITEKVPKFVKKYDNLNKKILDAVKKFSIDVKLKRFPKISNLYT